MGALPTRAGPRPATSDGLPHAQLDQQPADDGVRSALAKRVFALTGVTERPSGISVPGARALVLDASIAVGPPEAFMVGREFAHLHPGDDGSLHACLPATLAEAACRAGWAELHPLAMSGARPRTLVLLYAPRNEDELHVVAELVEASHGFAAGHARGPGEILATGQVGQDGNPSLAITAFRHAGLSVGDLDRSAAWYADVLGFRELFRESHSQRSSVIMRIPDTGVLLGLVHFADSAGDRFTPQRTGLDHLCFAVASREDLNAWTERLDEHGVAHSGVVEMATSPIVNFKDPDGIALAIALPLGTSQ